MLGPIIDPKVSTNIGCGDTSSHAILSDHRERRISLAFHDVNKPTSNFVDCGPLVPIIMMLVCRETADDWAIEHCSNYRITYAQLP
jgi:hypothetical protein